MIKIIYMIKINKNKFLAKWISKIDGPLALEKSYRPKTIGELITYLIILMIKQLYRILITLIYVLSLSIPLWIHYIEPTTHQQWTYKNYLIIWSIGIYIISLIIILISIVQHHFNNISNKLKKFFNTIFMPIKNFINIPIKWIN